MVSAVLSRISALPTEEPDAPAIKNGRSPTISCLGDGLKSGRQDKTPCNVESMRKRVTFRCVFSSPAPQTASMRHTLYNFGENKYDTIHSVLILQIEMSAFNPNMKHAKQIGIDSKYH